MSSNLTPIDISNMPDLLDLVEEVKVTKKPRELKRDDKVVAVLSPVAHVQGVRLNHTIFTREERPARVDDCIAL